MRKLIIFILIITPVLGLSQNTGYAGKKFIAKISFLNGNTLGAYLGAEYALTRHLSINAGVSLQQKSVEQDATIESLNYHLTQFQPPFRTDPRGIPLTSLPSAEFNRQSFRLSLKTYFNRVINRAPKGFFFEYGFDVGVSSLTEASINTDTVMITNSGFLSESNFINGVNLKGMNFYSLELMAGYQEIFSSGFTIEFSLGINSSSFHTNGNTQTYLVSNLSSQNYNNNFFNFSSSGGIGTPTTVTGLTGYLKIGYLLF